MPAARMLPRRMVSESLAFSIEALVLAIDALVFAIEALILSLIRSTAPIRSDLVTSSVMMKSRAALAWASACWTENAGTQKVLGISQRIKSEGH